MIGCLYVMLAQQRTGGKLRWLLLGQRLLALVQLHHLPRLLLESSDPLLLLRRRDSATVWRLVVFCLLGDCRRLLVVVFLAHWRHHHLSASLDGGLLLFVCEFGQTRLRSFSSFSSGGRILILFVLDWGGGSSSSLGWLRGDCELGFKRCHRFELRLVVNYRWVNVDRWQLLAVFSTLRITFSNWAKLVFLRHLESLRPVHDLVSFLS